MKTQTVLLILVGGFVGLPILACGGCLMLGAVATIVSPPDPNYTPPEMPPMAEDVWDAPAEPLYEPVGATMAMFQAIQPGMTYQQVVDIAGEPSQQLSQVEIAGVRSSVFQWDGSAFASNMQITFSQGRVMSKAQFGMQ